MTRTTDLNSIRAEMARRGERQRDIAYALGISQQTVSKHMTGLSEFSDKQLNQIADVLGVPVERITHQDRTIR